MRYLFLHADVGMMWNSSYWRCQVPCAALKAAGHEVKLRNVDMPNIEQGYDVVVFEREAFGQNVGKLEAARRMGARVWITFDDNYELLPPDSLSYESWTVQRKKDFGRALELVNGFMVPSKHLADYYARYNPNYRVIENYYPDAWLRHEDSEPQFQLGWSGSSEHIHSWRGSGALEALKKLSYTFLINCQSSHIMDALHGLYTSHVPWVPQKDYLDVASRFKLGLAPLSGVYDDYRSNIKLVLYGLAHRPWVASKVIPYQHSARGGVLVNNNPESWVQGIEAAMGHYDELKLVAREWAETYAIGKHIPEYEAL